MMLQKSIFAVGLAVMSFGLTGCLDATGTAAPTIELQSNNAQDVLSKARRNARSFGATGTVYGDKGAVVTYRGAPRNFIACDADADSLGRLRLNTRTTMRVVGSKIQTDTLYIATRSTSSGRKSIQFTDRTSGAFANGVRCRSTGTLERRILGLE